MAAITARIDQVSSANGRVYVRVGKVTREYPNAQAAVDALTLKADEVKEFLVRLLVTEWVRRNPALNNPNQITNVQASYDLTGTLTPLTFSNV